MSHTTPAITSPRRALAGTSVPFVTLNACRKFHFSARNTGVWTTPVGNPSTTVNASCAPSGPLRNLAVDPLATEPVHGRFDWRGPAKQAIFPTAAGTVTVAEAAPIGTDHSVPIAFQ